METNYIHYQEFTLIAASIETVELTFQKIESLWSDNTQFVISCTEAHSTSLQSRKLLFATAMM